MKQRSNAFFLIFAGIACVPGLVGCGWGANSSSEVSNVKGKGSKTKVSEVTLCDGKTVTTQSMQKWDLGSFASICQTPFAVWRKLQTSQPDNRSSNANGDGFEQYKQFCKAQIAALPKANKQAANTDDESAIGSSGKTNSLSAAFCPYSLTVDGLTVFIDELEKAGNCGNQCDRKSQGDGGDLE